MNMHRHPVWVSLAADYRSIMASSVSSKCTFSSASIKVSKQRNRLQADIVEALQFLKCFSHCDLIFREFLTSAVAEVLEENDKGEPPSWDELVELDNCNDTVK